MKKVFLVTLSVICILGALLSLWQFVTAIVFGELGRVLVYAVLAVLCIEFSVLSILILKDHK